MNQVSLREMVREVRQRTLDLTSDLSDEQMLGPLLSIVNPPLWEIGHAAWFQEKWSLREARGAAPLRSNADSLYDSAAIAHDSRWSLPLPSRGETLRYLEEVRDRVLGALEAGSPTQEQAYFDLLSVFHEDMHTEAFTYTRQTHGYPPPKFTGSGPSSPPSDAGPLPGDVDAGGEVFLLGATIAEPFIFDNEKWAHPVEVEPFRIARAAVTQSEFAAFVDDGAYNRSDLWAEDGWRWRMEEAVEQPVYWKRGEDGAWMRRVFDRWVPLEPHLPVLHVNWFEARAYCRWAGRRLPTEAEWELAASSDPRTGRKRRFPWGDAGPGPEHANLDWRSTGAIDVGALPAGDSPCGCRQMIGNVWEWTSSAFVPYPGFEIDPYKEYSAPWFYDHKVLRGGCWTTRAHLIRNTWRNFYKPNRRDVWAGFRTCGI